jgi:hypothetical protein
MTPGGIETVHMMIHKGQMKQRTAQPLPCLTLLLPGSIGHTGSETFLSDRNICDNQILFCPFGMLFALIWSQPSKIKRDYLETNLVMEGKRNRSIWSTGV